MAMLARKAIAAVVAQAAPSCSAARSIHACAAALTSAQNGAAPSHVTSMFHNPDTAARLTKRQRQVYETPDDLPTLPSIKDHGYLYGFTSKHLEGRSEAVKRALSTRTGNIKGSLTFKRSELLRKFASDPFNTGEPVVQVAMLSERINRMAAHLAANGGDADCKRRLTMATVARRKVLSYMQRRDYSGYRLAIQELGLRPLPIFHSAYLPKVRTETHKAVNSRNAKLKNRVGRGWAGH